MTNTAKHAERELDFLSKNAKDLEDRPIVEEFKEEIIALCEKFGNSGQSGGSAPFTSAAICKTIKKLLNFEPILPIIGIDDEWNDVSDLSDGRALYQNNRDSRVFKEGDKAYFLDAIIKTTQKGFSYHGSFWMSKEDYLTGDTSLKVSPKGVIKSFPFEPKTFYINVIEEEVAPDDWEMYIKDPKQLEQVWEYYDKY